MIPLQTLNFMKHIEKKTPNLGRAASNGMNRPRPAFTLTELLVTIGIISIVAAFTVPAYGAMRQSVGLNATVRQLVGVLHEAQSKSISSQDNAQFGVRFNGTSYTLYRVSPALDLRTVDTGLSISGVSSIEYTRLNGNVVTPGAITLGSKIITVSATGLVTVS